jgi:hypothetical protein
MPTLTNTQIVEAFDSRKQLAAEIADLDARITELQDIRRELGVRHEAAQQTTDVHRGIAVSVFDHYVSAVDYNVGRSAMVFEHAQRPGVFKVQAHYRSDRDFVIADDYASLDAAVLAAKDFVAAG